MVEVDANAKLPRMHSCAEAYIFFLIKNSTLDFRKF